MPYPSRAIYPFARLQIGDSFTVPYNAGPTRDSMRAMTYAKSREYADRRFSFKAEAACMRVVCVARTVSAHTSAATYPIDSHASQHATAQDVGMPPATAPVAAFQPHAPTERSSTPWARPDVLVSEGEGE